MIFLTEKILVFSLPPFNQVLKALLYICLYLLRFLYIVLFVERCLPSLYLRFYYCFFKYKMFSKYVKCEFHLCFHQTKQRYFHFLGHWSQSTDHIFFLWKYLNGIIKVHSWIYNGYQKLSLNYPQIHISIIQVKQCLSVCLKISILNLQNKFSQIQLLVLCWFKTIFLLNIFLAVYTTVILLIHPEKLFY